MTQHTSLPITNSYQIKSRQNYVRLLADVLLVCTAYLTAAQFSHRMLRQRDVLIIAGLGISWYLSAKLTELYNDFRTVTFVDELLALLPNVLIQLVVLTVSLFFLSDYYYARTFVVSYTLSVGAVIAVKMYLLRKLFLYWRSQGINQRQLVLVGEMSRVEGFVKLVETNAQFGYQIVGAWTYRDSNQKELPLENTLHYLNTLICTSPPDELIIASGQFDENYVRSLIKWADRKGILVRFIPGFFQFSSSRYSLELFGGFPLITVRSTPLESNHWWLLKRGFDIAFSSLFLAVIGSWLFPILALAIRLDSQGPILFKQKRWGQKGRTIEVWKFRTMYHETPTTDPEGKFHQTTANDVRITPLGRWLRKTNLDELPQFINVFLGCMSVVGPRPHAIQHSKETLPLIDNYMIRHRIKPGITGWAQVNGFRGETRELSLMRKRVDYDIWYLENWSLLMDVQIIARTVYNMLKGDPQAY